MALIAIAFALAVATYGVGRDKESVAMVGLVATALAAIATAAGVRKSIRFGARSHELLDRALAESELARDKLRVANERLQRRNADLEAFQLAVVRGFDLIDEQTQGRLKDLVEEAGDELADLVEDALDDPAEGAR